jgi:hypothetical protein
MAESVWLAERGGSGHVGRIAQSDATGLNVTEQPKSLSSVENSAGPLARRPPLARRGKEVKGRLKVSSIDVEQVVGVIHNR